MKLEEEHFLTLEALLGKFFMSSCTDPRYAVYSLLSSAINMDLKEWLPNYSSKKTEFMVFKKAFQYILCTSQSLDVMCRSQTKRGEPATWLPKFGQSFQCVCRRTFCFSHGNRDGSLTTFDGLFHPINPKFIVVMYLVFTEHQDLRCPRSDLV